MSKEIELTAYEKKYSEEKLWKKILKYSKVAGKKVILHALTLFYTLRDPDTPTWARVTIIGALGYFIFPIDLIPDFIPGVGYTDDLGFLLAALASVHGHIKDEHREAALEKFNTIFD